jgi:hypothetical protein
MEAVPLVLPYGCEARCVVLEEEHRFRVKRTVL